MGKESSSKGHSSRSAKAHSSRQKSSSGRHRSHGTSNTNSGSGHPLSFLFAVSEVAVLQPEVDTWGNARPPTNPGAYDPLDGMLTPVFLYQDGEVMDVSNHYFWLRDETGAGAIWPYPSQMEQTYPTFTYNQATICSCHPLLPYAVVNTDATVNETQVLADGDGINELTWEPLRFFFPMDPESRRITGLSQAVFTSSLGPDSTGGQPSTYVAGRGASWLHYLVPSTYENFSSSSPPSRGLGGDLTILLGLMAFTAPAGQGTSRARTVFQGQRWKHRRWQYNRVLSSYNRPASSAPEGVVVTVALDPANPGSTEEALSWFEFNEIAVRE